MSFNLGMAMHVSVDPMIEDDPEKGIASCFTRPALAVINQPGTELAIWKRQLPVLLREWIKGLNVSCYPEKRILIKPNDLRRALQPILNGCHMPAGDMRDLWVQDIADLVYVFSEITSADLVDVRLERINHDACWKFHRDYVDTRLITTYSGPTTEWVRPEHSDQALREQKKYTGPLEHFGLQDVAFFKGNLSGSDQGIVHRSPALAGTRLSRLVLCLNKQTKSSPEPWT